MNRKDKDPQAPEAEMRASRAWLTRAREAVGKTPQDFGEFVGGASNYYDLEAFDGELYTVLSLAEVSRLCSALAIRPRELFDNGRTEGLTISPEQLLFKAKDYMKRNNLSVAELSERIGFEIGPSLEDSANVLEWNVDFLRWLCDEIGLDWLLALPESAA